MSMPSAQNKTDLTTWQVESLRTTCFLSPAAAFEASTWWQDVVGQPSENRIMRAKDSFQQEDGTINNAKVVLGILPTRIDWLMGPSEAGNEFFIGSFQDSLDSYLDLMSRWFKICPPVRRLAFGVILMLPVKDRTAGYELMANYLPNVKLDPIGSSDFLYQINRPRDSQLGIPELEINRLTKWSVAKRGIVRFQLSPDAQVSLFPSLETYGCRLELDINTVADYKGDLPSEQLSNIFQELIDLGKEIAITGDIP